MSKIIKSTLHKIWDVCESMARANAASRLAREGHIEAARSLMLNRHKNI